jgi:electron transfer flavoprotein beta subunit
VKIAVCVKQVPDAVLPKRIDPQTKRLDRSVEGALNPFDVHAVEEALRIKEAGEARGRARHARAGEGDGIAAPRARDGADRAVLVSDERRAGLRPGRDQPHPRAALEREGADLILFGQQSSDSDGAVLWAAVADRLRLPVVSQVAELEVGDGKVKAKRRPSSATT